MVKRYVFVAEVIEIRRDFYLIAALPFKHPRQSRFRIRLPPMQLIHHVFTSAYLAQVLNTVIVFVAVDVVKLLLWPTAFADRPDGMVQINKNLFLTQTA